MDWVLENEPAVCLQVARFWLYNAFSLAEDYYHEQLVFVLNVLEENANLILFSLARFEEWVGLLRSLPLPSPERVQAHVLKVLKEIRLENLGGERSFLGYFLDYLVNA